MVLRCLVSRAALAIPRSNIFCSNGKPQQPYFSTSSTAASSPTIDGEFDVVVVGGGIVGCATARELSRRYPNLKLAIVEKESQLAAHQSSNNSGVIHAGIYYTPGSLKAKLCVRGLQLMYDYCDRHKVPYKKCGKLIVAVEPPELERLDALFQRGQENGVKDLEIVDGARIKDFEPNCKGLKAIWSPHTGITDYGVVTKSFGEDFEKRGGKIFLNFKINSFGISPEHQQSGQENSHPLILSSDNKGSVRCKYAITCAGLQADRVAELSGCSSVPKIVPFRGEYLMLKSEKRNLVNGNIYPVPDPSFPFLGVHFTPRMNGDVWLGPNAVLAYAREGYHYTTINLRDLADALMFRGMRKLVLKNISFGVNELYRGIFIGAQVKQLQRFVPQLRTSDVTRGPAGVRAQALDGDGGLVDDFVFDSGVGVVGKRVLHVRNAPSPACTSSIAISEMVADRAEEDFKL